jgi:galacturan 1,4-alpha-galacturonidase
MRSSLWALLAPLVAGWPHDASTPHGLSPYTYPRSSRYTCTVPASDDGSDDAPAIVAAFEECNNGGNVIFSNTTYNIQTPMNTTGLNDVHVDVYGTLLWSTDIDYWLNNSMPIGFQNQSTVWFFGGNDVVLDGHGVGTIDGNGQVWYDFVNGQSNYPHRPMSITVWGFNNSVMTGMRFRQSQMWTMAILYSHDSILSDIYVNNTSTGASTSNTDGADTVWTDNLVFRGWTVDNGDDAIAIKQNSTNILIEDCTFYRGQGFALGSIGQYDDQWVIIENVLARNITTHGTKYAGYVKTWTGDTVGYPPNGGGGGLGYVRNVTLDGFTLDDNRAETFSVSQCTNYEGGDGDCDSSQMTIEDIVVRNIQGTQDSSKVANLYCSAAGGCSDITFENIEVTDEDDELAYQYLCASVTSPHGWNCTGDASDNGGS